MFEEVLTARMVALNHLCNLARQDLEDAPDGKLVLTKSHGRTQYRWKKTSGMTAYLKQSQHPLAKTLAQKDYAQRVLHQANRELRDIDRLAKSSRIDKSHQPSSRAVHQALAEIDAISEIYKALPEAKKDLVDPFVLPASLFEKEWLAKAKEGEGLHPEGRVFRTENGLMVRSKSEVIIADKLFRAEIPFRYEHPIRIFENTVHPDFIILNTKTREELIWEHFGMMDDVSYCNHCLKKISLYASKGILLGYNLIATFESSTVPLDTAIVDKLVAGLSS